MSEFTVEKKTLKKYIGEDTEVVIPDGIEIIGRNAFKNCASITKVIIPQGARKIGEYAFYGCSNLESISIPKSVNAIGSFAFDECKSIKKVYINDIAAWCNIKFDSFSNPLSENAELYLNDEPVITLVIPQGVQEISSCAFNSCSSIVDVVLPDGLKKIGEEAFYGCHSLKKINIPSSLSYIGDHAFGWCSDLSCIDICDLETWCNIKFEENWGFSSGENTGKLYLNGKLVTDLMVPDSISKLKANVFKGFECITSVSLPMGIKSIGSEAFSGCNGITSVKLPDGIEKIEYGAFQYCENLSEINIPQSLTRIGESAFSDCNSLKNVCISSIESWCNMKFGDEWSFWEHISSPLEKALEVQINGETVTDLIIPDTVKTIKDYVFKDCHGIKSVTIPSSIKKIGKNVFYNSGFEAIINLSAVTLFDKIDMDSFEKIPYIVSPSDDFSKLDPKSKQVALASFLLYSDKFSESSRDGIMAYLKKQGSKKVVDYAQEKRLDLLIELLKYCKPTFNAIEKAIAVCEGSPEITAFLLNYQNENFDSPKEQEKAIKAQEKNLLNYELKPKKPKEPKEPKAPKIWLIRKDPDNTLRQGVYSYQGEEESVVVPAEHDGKRIEALLNNSFSPNLSNCTNLDYRKGVMKSVEISKGIAAICKGAFAGCQALETVILPESIDTIMLGAFSGCTSLQSIVIPKNVKRLTNYDFADCTSLTSITIPETVRRIGECTFQNCPNLTIYAPVGSYAEKYASENNIKFQAI